VDYDIPWLFFGSRLLNIQHNFIVFNIDGHSFHAEIIYGLINKLINYCRTLCRVQMFLGIEQPTNKLLLPFAGFLFGCNGKACIS
jgi:hypothetical protein